MFGLSALYTRLIGVGLIVLVLGAAFLYVNGLKKKIVNLNKEIVSLTQQNTILSTTLKSQNDAIAQLKIDTDARVEAGRIEVQKATALAAKNKAQAKIIYKKTPSTPGNDCKSALDLVNERP